MNKVKIVANTQVGSDNIEHLIGMVYDVVEVNEHELIVIHKGMKMPLAHEEYEYI